MDIFEDDEIKKDDKPIMEDSPIGLNDNNSASMKEPKKKGMKSPVFITIVVVTILALMASCISIGVLIGVNTGISKDMPMLIEAYKLVKKYYYEDISWEEFQEIATKEVVDAVDPFTFVNNTAPVQYSGKIGIILNSTTYNNHFINFIYPGSGAASAKAYERVLQNDPEQVEEIVDEDKKFPLEIGDELYAIFYNNEWVQVQHASNAYFRNIFNNISGDFIKIRVIKHGIVYGLPNGSTAMSEDLFYFDYIIKKSNQEFSQAFYVSPSEIANEDERQDVGYIRLMEFSTSAPRDFAMAVNEFLNDPEKPNKLILDLRSNGGGAGDILGFIGAYLINSPTTVKLLVGHSKQPNGKFRDEDTYTQYTYTYEDVEYNSFYIGNMVDNFEVNILVDGSTASSSEVLSYNLMFHNDSKLIGSQTYGKGVMQKVFLINGGKQEIAITNGKYYMPEKDESGIISYTKNIHGDGLKPLEENLIENRVAATYKKDVYIRRALECFGE